MLPGSDDGHAWDIFLPAGGSISGRDFGFRQVSGTGQSSNSSVSGRIVDDQGTPVEGVVVYLDSENLGVRDPNEPATTTDAAGNYSILNLGSSIVSVSTLLPDDVVHVSPLGSDFETQTAPLFAQQQPFSGTQAIVADDFNDDGFADVIVASGKPIRS